MFGSTFASWNSPLVGGFDVARWFTIETTTGETTL
jgi:hypothetical protein